MPPDRYLTDLSFEECLELSVELGGREFYGKILFRRIFQQGPSLIEEMTDLPAAFRESMAARFQAKRLRPAAEQPSRDGTVKALYRLPDGSCIESVLIPEGDRLTLCASTQVGCAGRCLFCASGQLGLKRNLSSGEIVEQVLAVRGRGLGALTNLVFMGIGEPLMNLENLAQAIMTINHPQGLKFGARRITVSTLGIPGGIRRLADLGLQVNLAVSLHAADETKRRELMPATKNLSLEEVLAAADYYRNRTTRDVTYEVLLLKDVNDADEDARLLAGLLKGRFCAVNLIPFNPVEGIPYQAPDRERVESFRRTLEAARIPVTVRKARGRDIKAACGQLRLEGPA